MDSGSDSNVHPDGGDVGGWGTMGGSVGDGFMNSPSFGQAPVPPPPGVPPAPQPASSYSVNTNPGYGSPPNQQFHNAPVTPGSGSITRFASPDMHPAPQPLHPQHQQQPTSFAARSQEAYGSYQQPPNYPNQMPPDSYAARSQSVNTSYAPVYPTPPPQQPTPAAVTGGGSYAARSQQAYGTQQQQYPPQAAYQQPSQVVVGQDSYVGGGAPAQQPVGSSSYASRSAQSYGSTVPQVQPSPQQSMTASSVSAGSYAERSAQALYGAPAPPQPQQSYGNVSQQQQFGQQSQLYGQSQPGMMPGQQPGSSSGNVAYSNKSSVGVMRPIESPQAIAMQQRLLTDATRKVQEHAYYMKQAMEQQNLPVVLDRAAHMVGELGGPSHGNQHYQQQQQQQNNNNPNASGPSNTGGSSKLTPKNYYELYMRALEEMPAFDDYLMSLSSATSNTTDTSNNIPHDHIRIVDTSFQQSPAFAPQTYTMRELYDCVQYCPRVVSRLYLQIAAGSALIRAGEAGAKFVMKDLQAAVKCEQNPIRGLFLRHYLLTALKDKLPVTPVAAAVVASTVEGGKEREDANNPIDATSQDADVDVSSPTSSSPQQPPANSELEPGTVEDAYKFVLANFMEMNKLWVRIQHLPGEGKNKEVKKRRERERNDLRILVGTNLVRLSQLESVTSKIYGEIILPQILEHIVVAGDPLSQAYLMDCLVQVFPDEYHIETLPILLNVCPRLRDKVNIRTILQGLMDRLANYLADEELLDESDTNEVKKTLARDSFGMFEDCVQAVYNARGPKLTSREVIRLQTVLLQFSIKCYPENMEQVVSCIASCVSALRQANASYEFHEGTVVEVPYEKMMMTPLDDVAVVELEKLLSIPLDTLALKVLRFEEYSALIGFLPWVHRREVAMKLLTAAVESSESIPASVQEVEVLFRVIEPLIRDEHVSVTGNNSQISPDLIMQATAQMAGLGMNLPNQQYHPAPTFASNGADTIIQYSPEQLDRIRQENALVSKFVHLLSENTDPNVVYEMLVVSRNKIISSGGGRSRVGQTLVPLVFAALRVCRQIMKECQPKQVESSKIQDAPPKNDSVVEAQPDKSEDVTDNAIDESLEKKSDTPEKQVADIAERNDVELAEKVDEMNQANLEPEEKNVEANIDTLAAEEAPVPNETSKNVELISCRKVFVFIQEAIAEIAKYNPETSVKLYLDVSLSADGFASMTEKRRDDTDFAAIAFEFLSQAFAAYEERVKGAKMQYRCLISMVGTLMASKSLSKEQYEGFITKTAQCSARMTKKQEQCHLVALCAHLFYPVGSSIGLEKYSNSQRALECLQRCLKLADASTATNPAHVKLFVDILEHYVFFFENGNASVTHGYITGLVALIREHLSSLPGGEALSEASTHFDQVTRYILKKKEETDSKQLFAPVNLGVNARHTYGLRHRETVKVSPEEILGRRVTRTRRATNGELRILRRVTIREPAPNINADLCSISKAVDCSEQIQSNLGKKQRRNSQINDRTLLDVDDVIVEPQVPLTGEDVKPSKPSTKVPAQPPMKAPTPSPMDGTTHTPVITSMHPLPTPRITAPTKTPATSPIDGPTKVPAIAPTLLPAQPHGKTPTKKTTKAPVEGPTKAPAMTNIRPSSQPPINVPTVESPTATPMTDDSVDVDDIVQEPTDAPSGGITADDTVVDDEVDDGVGSDDRIGDDDGSPSTDDSPDPLSNDDVTNASIDVFGDTDDGDLKSPSNEGVDRNRPPGGVVPHLPEPSPSNEGLDRRGPPHGPAVPGLPGLNEHGNVPTNDEDEA